MDRNNDSATIDGMLRHLACGQDLRDFPCSASEKIARIRTASRRGLITWRRGRSRYELTSIGWTQLTPRRRFTLASLMLSSALGATIGAAAMAILWLPGDASHRTIRAHSIASTSRTAVYAPASRSTEAGTQSPSPSQTTSALPSPLPAVAVDPGPGTMPGYPPIKAPEVADEPSSAPPSVVASPTDAKPGRTKKVIHKTAHQRRKQRTVPTWAYSDPWRSRQFGYSGYGQDSWLAYR
jgi:hypothetical protein